MSYYNEIDPKAAAWLRNLVERGLIAPGQVDSRSILEVPSVDLRADRQSHFFAGIGAWSHALRLAGVSDDWPIWTGSCPCQPFSTAGLGLGTEDDRHLWPAWFDRIEKCGPPIVFGEQVASRAGRDWLASVRSDLEGVGYAVGGADLCGASVGAPHIRQRIFFGAIRLADTDARRRIQQWSARLSDGQPQRGHDVDGRVAGVGLADANGNAGQQSNPIAQGRSGGSATLEGARSGGGERVRGLGVSDDPRLEGFPGNVDALNEPRRIGARAGGPAPAAGFWDSPHWVYCRDRGGVWRPIEPGTFPLANGVAARVVKLRAYGNAIIPQVAAEFVKAFLRSVHDAL